MMNTWHDANPLCLARRCALLRPFLGHILDGRGTVTLRGLLAVPSGTVLTRLHLSNKEFYSVWLHSSAHGDLFMSQKY